MELDDLNTSREKLFNDNYSYKRTLYCNIDKKPKLKKKEARVCRFCETKTPEVTFKKEAHIIPQLLGNRYLISDFECDLCNSHFSKFENSFANLLGPFRTFSSMCGQRKIPKFKDKLRTQEIFIEDKKVIINVYNSDTVTMDFVKKEIKVESDITTYVPLQIYKLLMKIGLSIITENELTEYSQALDFLNRKKKIQYSLANSDFTKIFWTFVPGPFISNSEIHLYERISNSKLVPKHTFIMYFRNHQLQFFLPWNSSDIQFLEGKKIDVPCFPILIDHKKLEQYGKAETKRMDFSNDQKIQNEKIKYSFSFGDFQKYSPEEIEKLNIDLKK